MSKRDQSAFGSQRAATKRRRSGSGPRAGNSKPSAGELVTRRRVLGALAAGVVVAAVVRAGLPSDRAARLPRPTRRALASEPAPAAETPREEPAVATPAISVGSAAVLAALWTPEELRSQPGEARIVRLRPADHTPPDRSTLRDAPSPLPAALAGSIRRVKPKSDAKLVAFTFDLCERADDVTGYDGDIVDTLREGRVPATFFAGGAWLRRHAERAQQLIADPLFEVGNHAWTHGNLRVLTGEAAEQQVLWTMIEYECLRDRIVARAEAKGIDARDIAQIPLSTLVFRFPYGVCSPESLAMVARLGMTSIQWDVISGDAVKGQSAETVRRSVVDQVKPGSIVVFHGNGRGSGTAAALPAIIRALAERDYRFVTVSHLLDAGQPIAVDECYELRPGDNHRYDRLFGEGTG